jgi:hypothetical protein
VSLPSNVSHWWFLIAVFAAIGIVIATSFVLFSLQPPRPPPTSNLIFTSASVIDGNVSFAVQNVSHGPYVYSGFAFRLIVNNFAVGPTALRPNGSAISVTVGTTTDRITWIDADGDGAVSVGDRFLVTGDRAPLSSLSDYEFDLQWGSMWAARVFWSTY